MAKPKIVFFVRRYNDIDHIVPIIYRMVKDNVCKPEVLCLNPTYDIGSDERLKFLKKHYGVKIDYVYRVFCHTPLHFIVAFSICTMKAKGRIINLPLRRNIFNLAYRLLTRKKYLFGESWAFNMLKKKNPAVIVLDWQQIKSFRLPKKKEDKKNPDWRLLKLLNTTFYIVESAKKLNIPLIAVPHGMNLVTNELITWSALRENKDVNYGFEWRYFDYIIVPNALYGDRLAKAGIGKDTVKVIGSPRYCDEWWRIYKDICTSSRFIRDKSVSSKLKIVFMDHSHKYRMKEDCITESIRKIIDLGFTDLIIKPTTRPNADLLDGDYARGVSSQDLLNIAMVAQDVNSLALIQWADVVVCTISSICIEVLLQNKILLYPKYFHENTMLFEEMKACWQVNNYEELENALKKIYDNPGYKPYPDINVKKFIVEAVYGGVENRDVLGEYEEFILSKTLSGGISKK